LRYYYDVDGVVPNDHYLVAAQIIKAVAASDGVFSDQERDAFIAIFRSAGTPDWILDEFDDIDAFSVKISDLLPQMSGNTYIANTHIVYAATAISAADSFASTEQSQVESVGSYLQVSQSDVSGIIENTLAENAGRVGRLRFMGGQSF